MEAVETRFVKVAVVGIPSSVAVGKTVTNVVTIVVTSVVGMKSVVVRWE